MRERQSSERRTGLRWLRRLRSLLIGLAAEFALSLVAVPFAVLRTGQAVLYIVLLFGASALPGAPSLDLSVSFSPAYLATHALKLVGGGIGGWLAAGKSRRA